jgi:predicted nuclease of predicted toxin-antitoxin system
VSTPLRFHILLDQGLPREAAEHLRNAGIECTHVGEIGMSASSDTDIPEYARAAGRIIVTLDADFHTILVVSGMSAPSVIRICLEDSRVRQALSLAGNTPENDSREILIQVLMWKGWTESIAFVHGHHSAASC